MQAFSMIWQARILVGKFTASVEALMVPSNFMPWRGPVFSDYASFLWRQLLL